MDGKSEEVVIQKIDEKYIKTFHAIVNFVEDLWGVFGSSKKISPLALYRRLLSKIKFTDSQAIDKALTGFKNFLNKYEDEVLNNNLSSIPRDTCIYYGTNDKIYLEIQKYIHNSDSETVEIIRRHLVTISAILEPDSKKFDELEKRLNDLNIDSSTYEGQFITGIMQKARNTMEKVDANDPTQAIMGLMSSGVIQDMIVGLQSGVGSGQMDMYKLLGSMQTAIGAIMPRQPQAELLEDGKNNQEK